ncbi:MAG: tetratricopeptide repeat protein [Pedobacter sp.]|jgi:signal transduction histidine kinase|uniref:tetratricopeptide repeat protein n=1 Tax=Pedobacter sp. TaxID=1411316 RepID=UPI0035684949
MKFTLILILFYVTGVCQVNAQRQRGLDSLKRTLKKPSVTEQAKNLNKLSSAYFNTNLDSAIQYANKSISFSTQHKIYKELATGYNYLGQMMYYKGNYVESLSNFEKFRAIAVIIEDNVLATQANNNIANVLIDQGKTDDAIQKYEEILATSKKNNDKKGQSLGYGNLAFVYRYIGNNAKAISYIFEQMKIDEELDNKMGLAHSYQQLVLLYNQKNDLVNAKKYLDLSLDKFKELNDGRNIAVSYDLYATYFASLKNTSKAIEHEKMAINLADKYGDKRSLAIFQSKLANFYFEEGLYEQAAKDFIQAINLHEAINLQKTLAAAYIGYGKTLLKLNKIDQAKVNLDKGLALAINQKSAIDKRSGYEAMTEYFIRISEPNKAIKSQKQFIAIKDSLLNENNSKQINELNTIYQTQKKEQQILLLDKQNLIQVLKLNENKLVIENKNLELDKNNFRIESQNLSLQKNKALLTQKQAETKAKTQQIKLLAIQNDVQKLEILKRNILLSVIAGVLLITILLGYLLYNRYKLKQETRLQKAVLTQQDLAAKSVLNAEENERKRISGELHDGLGQMFSAVKMNLSALTDDLTFKDESGKKMFEKTLNLVDESCKEVRSISHQMAPNVLLKSGLANAVRDFINKIDARKLKINLETFGLQQRLDQNVETVLYRVIQETVNNVIKHSGANSLDIQLTKDNEGINVMIEDNGKGFDTTSLEKFEGIGLKNIQSRVEYLKGVVDFSSKLGSGTLVAIHIPL